jgi:hypothetical protein
VKLRRTAVALAEAVSVRVSAEAKPLLYAESKNGL